MKYGLFSDVHGNLEAFEVALKVLREEGVDHYIFVGDIVGYGANPRECLRTLRDLAAEGHCVMVGGNHDYAVCGLTRTDNYVLYAKEVIDWTKNQLDQEDIKFLAEMKLVEHGDNFTCVHSNLEAPEKWGYIFDIDDAFPNFKLTGKQICFIGHSHKPVVFTASQTVDWAVKETIPVEDDKRYIINIGSVGQPRDGNPNASFAVYDADKKLVEIKRTEYDIKTTQTKILEAKLPKILAERLTVGK